MATDSSTINRMTCPPDDMSELTENDVPSAYTSNIENVPEFTDVTGGKPPSIRMDVIISRDTPAIKHNIINIEPSASHLHVATNEQQEIHTEARQRLETMSGLHEFSLDNIINVPQHVLSTLYSDIMQIGLLHLPPWD